MCSVVTAFAVADPAPAPATPSSAVTPIPTAIAGPTPGINRVAATTPAVIPDIPPANAPAQPPNSLASLVASVSEVVRKAMDSFGTCRFNNCLIACSAFSREWKTPIAVSIWAPFLRWNIRGRTRGRPYRRFNVQSTYQLLGIRTEEASARNREELGEAAQDQ